MSDFTTVDARDDVAATFLAYRALLGRNPDESGFEHYTTVSTETGDLSTAFNDIVGSAEFDGHGFMTTESLVEMIYTNLFDREASDSEVEYWVDHHEHDGGWGSLAASIAMSEEGYANNYQRMVLFEANVLGVEGVSIDAGTSDLLWG